MVRPPALTGAVQPSPATTAKPVSQTSPQVGEPETPIRWSDPPSSSVAWQRCSQARAAVLIDNTASNRQRRDSACAALQGSEAAVEPGATSGRSPVVMAEPWKTLRSAAELTPD
jgi:hypothetical protein